MCIIEAARVGPAIGAYTCEVKLGSGAFGTVVAAKHCVTGTKAAIKIIPKEKVDPETVRREINNHQCLEHPYVAKFYEAIETEHDTCLVMELVSGGDLFDYIVEHVRLEEPEAQQIFKQIIAGVAHCHDHNVVHRDLKPENILLDEDMNVRIIDFGLSAKICADSLLTESCGSLNYAAPELLYKNCSYKGPEVDMWSCGVILYTLLCGCLPFDDDCAPRLCKKIKLGRYRIPGHVSSEAKDLIEQMLCVVPQKRITLAQILNHSWLNVANASAAPSKIPSEASSDCKPEHSTARLVPSQGMLMATPAEPKSNQQLKKIHRSRFSTRSCQFQIHSSRAARRSVQQAQQ